MKRRVLAVDDSSFIRRLVADIINSFENFEVADSAKDGIEALELLSKNKYDVVIMDVEMPRLNGIETLKKIKKLYPSLPVIMFSTLTKDGAELTLEALDIGAFDFVTKPVNIFKVNTEDVQNGILNTLSTACRIRVPAKKVINPVPTSGRFGEIKHITPSVITPITKKTHRKSGKKLIAIGTSTGGPKALQDVVTLLPKNIPAPILIVQHMPIGFIEPMAKRLDSMSQIKIKQAENGEKLENGVCYIGPGGQNLRINEKFGELYIELKDDQTDSVHRPSVDVLFSSLYNLDSRDITAVIMTGMGADGAKGMKLLHDSGHFCIAQDKDTCTVFGMPGSAVKLGAVDVVVPLNKIASEIIKRMEV